MFEVFNEGPAIYITPSVASALETKFLVSLSVDTKPSLANLQVLDMGSC